MSENEKMEISGKINGGDSGPKENDKYYYYRHKDGQLDYVTFTYKDIKDELTEMILEYHNVICRSFFVD